MMDSAEGLRFPECCTCCPHLQPVKASCGHEHRQAVVRELADDEPCPVFREERAAAMRDLSESLGSE